MIAYSTIYTLFVTRILQGIGVALITGTGAAYLTYLGFGLPIILIGFLADQFGIVNALLGYGVIVIANLILALYQGFMLEQQPT
jgi:hypothetical protein